VPEYYFDIETTGLDPNNDRIITFQYQELSQVSGIPLTKLVIAKEWEDDCSEGAILEWIKELLIDSPFWRFVPVGNNLLFDLTFIAARMHAYFHADFSLSLINRPFIDLKHVLVMINGGHFRNYSRMIAKTDLGSNVPVWYQKKQYERIVNYIEMEAEAFVRTYGILKRNLPALAALIV
jgi:hypothetical protein